MNKKSGKFLQKIFIVALALFVLISIATTVYIKKIMKTDKMYDNIFINEIEVSNLTKGEAKKLLDEKFKYGTLTLNLNDKKFVQDLQSLGFSYNIDEVVGKAYMIGRNGNFIEDFMKVLKLKTGLKENIDLTSKENYEKLDEFYKNVASQVNVEAKNASISIDGSNISISDSQTGQKIDLEKLKDIVEKTLKESEEKSLSLEIPVVSTEPKVKAEQLKSINGVIAEYSSRYNTSNVERSFNVGLTAERMNNVLVMPGEEISFMNRLGDVSIANGFKVSKIIVNNEYQDGIGGGVCQVSSTLYNALLMSGVDITQRTNHSFPIGYVPTGRDATVATGGPDLKYRNNYDFPIFIKTYAYDGVMSVDVYGDTTKAKRYEIVSEITNTVEPNVVYKNDPTLPKGKEVVEDFGHTGYTAVSYKVANGNKSRISTDTYIMTPKIIKLGTGAQLQTENKVADKESKDVPQKAKENQSTNNQESQQENVIF